MPRRHASCPFFGAGGEVHGKINVKDSYEERDSQKRKKVHFLNKKKRKILEDFLLGD